MAEKLVLHIEVPEFNCEDLQEFADEYCDGDLLWIVTEESIRPEVGVTFVTQPGAKCANSDFEVVSRTCRIVGAEIKKDEEDGYPESPEVEHPNRPIADPERMSHRPGEYGEPG